MKATVSGIAGRSELATGEACGKPMRALVLGSAPVGPAVRPIRNLDGQQNVAHPKILGAALDTELPKKFRLPTVTYQLPLRLSLKQLRCTSPVSATTLYWNASTLSERNWGLS